MSRSSSLSGLGRGRARGRRDIAESEQLAERRPGRFRIEDWEGELAGTQSDAESKWITMEYNAPSPYPGYTTYNTFYFFSKFTFLNLLIELRLFAYQGSLKIQDRKMCTIKDNIRTAWKVSDQFNV